MRKSKYTKELLSPLVSGSTSISEVLRKLNLKVSGGNHRNILCQIKKLNLDMSHFTGNAWNKGMKGLYSSIKTSLEEILIENSIYSSSKLKPRLIKAGLMKEECLSCGLGNTWNGKSIVLQLDHINGNCADNRLENLRILCPNCHSQTRTYCRK